MHWASTDDGLAVAHLTKNKDEDGSKKTNDEDLLKVMRELIPDHEAFHVRIYPHDS